MLSESAASKSDERSVWMQSVANSDILFDLVGDMKVVRKLWNIECVWLILVLIKLVNYYRCGLIHLMFLSLSKYLPTTFHNLLNINICELAWLWLVTLHAHEYTALHVCCLK